MCECVCGLNISKGNTRHFTTCQDYQLEVKRLKKNIKTYIVNYYLETYSVTDCCLYIREKEKTKVFGGKLRSIIVDELKIAGVYEGLTGKRFNEKRQVKIQATVLKNYGVVNVGQLSNHGFKSQNQIPYVKLKINEDYMTYKKEVEHLTWKQFGKLKKLRLVSETCYYTGIKFNDNLLEKVNPNDPFKRTIDHKISVTEAFFRGWTAEKTASMDNLAFCLRIVNTIKGHQNENDFRKILLPLLNERLENENKVN